MDIPLPETRPIAPGPLAVLHLFINSGHLGTDLGVPPETPQLVRERTEAGEHQASLAKEFGVGRMLISAMGRGAPMFDELASSVAAEEWLRTHGLLDGEAVVDDTGLGRLVEFRELLRLLAIGNAHGEVDATSLSALTELARNVPLVAAFDAESGLEVRPAGKGADEAIGRLLVILYDSMRDGSWRRLKRCPGTGCPFTFYDSSRNRTAVWCSMSVCGNRAKVRNYQERARATRG